VCSNSRKPESLDQKLVTALARGMVVDRIPLCHMGPIGDFSQYGKSHQSRRIQTGAAATPVEA
jgi:hypothetical protein